MESTPERKAAGQSRPRSRLAWRTAIAAGALVFAFLAYGAIRDFTLARELVRTSPDRIPSDAWLVRYGNALGRRAFGANCVSCHGGDLKGSQMRGVPNLTDDVWLYDFGRISDIERTILYGIRSGHGRAHNVTDMPAIGRQKALDTDEIRDVIAYTLSLSKHPEDAAAVMRGSMIFQDKGVCYDCHSRDAAGIPDYGAPNLTDGEWLYGSDEATLYKSIYDGRHGLCPAWIGKLSFATIRALAVYVHSMSKESPESPDNRSASNGGLQRPGHG